MKSRLYLTLIFITGLVSWNFAQWSSPALVSPNNGATVWTGENLNWDAVTNSENYEIQIDTSQNFNSPVLASHVKAYINSSDNNSDTKLYVEDLYFGSTYYWRVRAYVAGDTSAWVQRSFDTRDYVNLDAPSSGATTWTGTSVDWNAHDGVEFYDLELDTSANFNSPVILNVSNTYINSSNSNSDTKHSVEDLFFGQTYHWRVRARNAVDTSEWSVVRNFTTREDVTLEAPLSGATTWTGTSVDWNAHDGVEFYDLELDTSANFNSPVILNVSNTYINSSNSNSDTKHSVEDLFFGKTYHWRVRARNAVDTSEWSVVRNFTTREDVTLDGPLSGATTWTGTAVNWDAHDGVEYYDLELDTSANFNSPVILNVSNTYINSSNSNSDTKHSVEDLFFGKTYHWRVRARNAVDTSEWSVVRNFDTRDYVNLTYPNNQVTNINTSGINTNWNAHDGIVLYQYQIDTVNAFNSTEFTEVNKTYINSSNSNNDTYEFTGALFTNQVYFWRVRAINNVDTSAWRQRTFSTGSCVPTAQPNPINGLATVCSDNAVTYSVDPVSGATSYDWTIPSGWSGSSTSNSITITPDQSGGLIEVYAVNSCGNSLVQSLNITSNPSYNINEGTSEICDGDSLLIYGQYRKTAGVYYDNHTTTEGCDSIYSKSLVVNTIPSTSVSAEICPNDSIFLQNDYQTQAGVYTDTLITTSGCDSLIVTTLTVNSNLNGTETKEACNSYTWPLNNTTYNTSGTYSSTLSSVNGCDSTVNLVLTINTVNTGVTLNSTALSADQNNSSYQWIDCSTNSIITGATDQSYTPAESGTYAVEITSNGCSDTSDCYQFEVLNLTTDVKESNLRIYPNPSRGLFTVENYSENSTYEVIDVTGKRIARGILNDQNNKIDLSKKEAGVYIVEIESAIYRIIKE